MHPRGTASLGRKASLGARKIWFYLCDRALSTTPFPESLAKDDHRWSLVLRDGDCGLCLWEAFSRMQNSDAFRNLGTRALTIATVVGIYETLLLVSGIAFRPVLLLLEATLCSKRNHCRLTSDDIFQFYAGDLFSILQSCVAPRAITANRVYVGWVAKNKPTWDTL